MTETLTRQCPFNGCKARLDARIFACRKHWFSLSLADRERINWAFQQYVGNHLTIDELQQIQQSVLGNRGKA